MRSLKELGIYLIVAIIWIVINYACPRLGLWVSIIMVTFIAVVWSHN